VVAVAALSSRLSESALVGPTAVAGSLLCTTQLPKRCLQLWVNYNQLTYSVCFVIDLFFGVLCLFFTRSVLPESIFMHFLCVFSWLFSVSLCSRLHKILSSFIWMSDAGPRIDHMNALLYCLVLWHANHYRWCTSCELHICVVTFITALLVTKL